MRTAKLLKFIGGVFILVAIVLFLRALRTSHSNQDTTADAPTSVARVVPLLEQAKQTIPVNLDAIYKALNEGNPMAARGLVAQGMLNNYGKLDYVCKPYTLRSHYIEAIIERPGGQFEVRTRVLFQPIQEQAYILLFRAVQGQFILEDVTERTDDWFGPEKEAATELARNFIYAAKAHKAENLAPLLVPSVPPSPFATDRCWQQFFYNTKEPQINSVELKSYKGLKMEVVLYLDPGTGFGYSALGRSHFLVDRVGDDYKIVSADPRGDYNMLFLPEEECPDKSVLHKVEDPNLEERTLRRFGLRASN
jgi:hypothetical protein